MRIHRLAIAATLVAGAVARIVTLVVLAACDKPAVSDQATLFETTTGPDGSMVIVENRPPASEQARRIAEFRGRDAGITCAAYDATTNVPFGSFIMRFQRPRPSASGVIVPLSVRNTAPVMRRLPDGAVVITKDGASHPARHDVVDARPDTWTEVSLAIDVDPRELDGAVLYWSRMSLTLDRHEQLAEHVVVDLPR